MSAPSLISFNGNRPALLETGPDGLARRAVHQPRRLTLDELEQALRLDPTDSHDRGRLRALRARVDDDLAPEARLIDAQMQMPKRPCPPAPAANPARLTRPIARSEGLSPSDLEWIRRLPSDPKDFADDDVRRLAELEAGAASESDCRLLATVLGPARRIHDRREEETRLAHQLAEARHPRSTPAIARLAEAALRDVLTREARATVEREVGPAFRARALVLAEDEAHREAAERIHTLEAQRSAELAAREAAADKRLLELHRGAEPESSEPPPVSPGYEAGLARGRAAAAAAGKGNLLDGLRVVGTT